MSYCEDCGTKLNNNRCPNCHEELIIFEEQYSEFPPEKPLSNSFIEKVNEQRKLLNDKSQEVL